MNEQPRKFDSAQSAGPRPRFGVGSRVIQEGVVLGLRFRGGGGRAERARDLSLFFRHRGISRTRRTAVTWRLIVSDARGLRAASALPRAHGAYVLAAGRSVVVGSLPVAGSAGAL